MTPAGAFSGTPAGVILHGTRSGRDWTLYEEYSATLRFAESGAGGLGWNVTIGDGMRYEHINPGWWGWNAREHSSQYLAAEFAQAQRGDPITDGQVGEFADWFVKVARKRWPELPLVFPEHYELPAGQRDGKSDVDPDHPGLLARRCREAILRLDNVADKPADADLVAALAYVCDDLGDRLQRVEGEAHAIRLEMQRVREQFVGPRP